MIYYTPPTPADDADEGFVVGSLWVVPAERKVYIARDVTVGAAVWEMIEPGVILSHSISTLDTTFPMVKRQFTANSQTQVVDVSQCSALAVQVTVAGTLAVSFEASLDGVVWSAIPGFLGTNGSSATSATNPGSGTMWRFNVAAYRFFRLRVTAFTAAATFVFSRSTFGAETLEALSPLTAGSNVIGKVGLDVGNHTSPTLHRLLAAAATTNATLVKNAAGRLLKVRGYNGSASVRYLKLFNKASAPTVGTDVPIITIALKAADVFDLDLGNYGYNFSTGISYAITGALADNDTTAIAANDIVGIQLWYV